MAGSTIVIPSHGSAFLSPMRIFLLLFVTSLSSSFCFTPDGTLSTDLPCNPGAGNTTCCALDFFCLTNNFCLDSNNIGSNNLSVNGIYIRGTCTDESWQSGACAQHCVSSQPNSGEKVVYCGGGTYCCDADAPNCCANSTVSKFELADPNVYTEIGQATVPSSARIASATPVPILSDGQIQGIPPTGTATISVSSSISSTPTASSAPVQLEEGGTKDRSVAVGIGVGVPLSVLLLATIAGSVWWLRKLEKRVEDSERAIRAEVRTEMFKAVELNSIGSASVYEMEHEPKKFAKRAEMP